MNINDLTIGQARDLVALFGSYAQQQPQASHAPYTESLINRKVIIRTQSAGVWFGVLIEKSGNEVILTAARRMWRWWAAESISLSAVALHGVKADKSKIAEAVPLVWLEAIEIISCSGKAATQLEGIEHAKAE